MLGGAGLLHAGHEVSYYPAFYPSEITLSALDPKSAAKALAANKLHVYLGATPSFEGAVPAYLRSATSVGGFAVLTLDPARPGLSGAPARCAVAAEVLAVLATAEPLSPAVDGTGSDGDFVFHPYPMTPFHEDYIVHADRVHRAIERARARDGGGAPRQALRGAAGGRTIQAQGVLARRLEQAGWKVSQELPASGIAFRVVPEAQALGAAGSEAWAAPPWLKEGWYEAWRLLAPGLDGKALAAATPLARQLMQGDVKGHVERFNLERRLVDALMRPCTRVVAGYTMRHEYTNDDYTFGIENIAPDSAQGLNNPVFVRTVKLKDFPWNGPLFAATAAPPKAAWNPVAGFGDEAGRFAWAILADNAYMNAPDGERWVPNRMGDVASTQVLQLSTASIPVPPDALLPEPGTGVFRPVGPGKKSFAKVSYRVLASPFFDGSDTEVEDLLYPYAFAFRWGAGAPQRRDAAVASATELLRERLVGVRVVATQRYADNLGGLDVPRMVHLIEVYVNQRALDPLDVAELAPPWSALPWQLWALQEEAVGRGLGAFSEEEARRKNVPWLDLARDPAMIQTLRRLLSELEASRFRPVELSSGALASRVTPEIAAKRWAALSAFFAEHGHFLDTNGAYVLKRLGTDGIHFEVVRNFKYAVGLGAFNILADAPSARVTGIERKGSDVFIHAELELIERVQRDTVVTRAPLKQGAARGFKAITPRARLVVIGPDGRVLASKLPKWQDDGSFMTTLPGGLTQGTYTLAAAVYADDNTTGAGTSVLSFEVR